MRDSAKILSVGENGRVTVLPVIKDACISCSRTSCAKAGTPFTVMNSRSLNIRPGMTVRIAAKKKFAGGTGFGSACAPHSMRNRRLVRGKRLCGGNEHIFGRMASSAWGIAGNFRSFGDYLFNKPPPKKRTRRNYRNRSRRISGSLHALSLRSVF